MPQPGVGLRVVILGVNYAPEPTGIAPYTTGLAEGLRGKGHVVRVLTSYPHYPQWSRPANVPRLRTEGLNGVTVERHRHYVPHNPGALRRAAFEMSFGARLVRRPWRQADVVVGISPALLSCAVAFARARTWANRPALGLVIQDIYSTGVSETGTGGGLASTAMQRLESRTARLADGVAVIHDRFAKRVEEGLGVAPDRVTVIRNWTHVPHAGPFDKSEFRAAMGWAADEVVVLHAGNMGAKQGLENVVEAGALADSLHAPVRFVLLGNGTQRHALEEKARDVRSVQFVDPLDEIGFQRALGAADILLVNEKPGVLEMAVPSKLTSYFSAGRPVLAATEKGSTTASELESAGAGARVAPGDPAALLTKVMEFTRDPGRCEAWGKAGVDYASRVLSQSAAVDAYDAWIRELGARRARGRGK